MLIFSGDSDESSFDSDYYRKRQPERSKSIDSYLTIPRLSESPLFDHQPLHHEVERVNYRTTAALKYYHDDEHDFSPDEQDSYDRYRFRFRTGCSRADDDSSDELTTLDDIDSETIRTPEPERSPEQALCERCRGINVERLSGKNGYTHSFFDVLERSIKSCPLCYTFFYAVNHTYVEWALDRYKITLSLESHQGILSDHHLAPVRSRKCVWLSVIDTRPWEPRIGEVHRFFEKKEVAQKSSQEERSIIDLRILCYTEEGDPAASAGVPWLRKPVGHTGSPAALSVAKGWLEQCIAAEKPGGNFGDIDSGHQLPQTSLAGSMPDMRKPSSGTQNLEIKESKQPNGDMSQMDSYTQFAASSFPAERPSRLVEIVRYRDVQPPDRIVRLIETNGEDYAYVALSYCWGSPTGSWLTTKETIEESFRRIDIDNLPATLKDAIHATFSLGLKYLWVDALCIVQNSMHDWANESAMMGGIYRGAQLTLAVSKSSSSSEGCFNQDQYSECDPFANYTCVEGRLENNRVTRLYFEKFIDTWGLPPPSGSFQTEVYESPLASRAWTYQEQILSRRTLFFAQSQLYWECDHCRLSLDNKQQAQHLRAYPILTLSQPMSKDEVIEKWYRGAAEVYSRRKLTNPSDKLVAISAIAKATFLNRHVNYIAGLWEDCILTGLCWYRYGAGKKSRLFSCPSWSWASQESYISYGATKSDFEEPNNSSISPNVLDIQIETNNKNQFGDVAIGRITLLTHTTAGIVMRDKFGRRGLAGLEFNKHISSGTKALLIPEANGWNIWHGYAIMDDDAHKGQAVLAALVSDWKHESHKWLMILLEPSKEGEQEYRRVGLGMLQRTIGVFNGSCSMPNVERDWDERTITIV